MNCCCEDDKPAGGALSSASHRPAPNVAALPRRITAVMRWVFPVTVLALVPKCPACVAAYVLLFTGIGLSFSAAAAIRWALIAVSIASLIFLSLGAARRAIAVRPAGKPASPPS